MMAAPPLLSSCLDVGCSNRRVKQQVWSSSPPHPTPPLTPPPKTSNIEYCQVLVDAVVHAVNEDYENMAGDFIKLGFLTPGEGRR